MQGVRIDKWLWAARFYKTRSLAANEIGKGRVHVNGATVKPARDVKVGDTVQVRTGLLTRSLMVQAVSDKRGPAAVAALLFQETPESITRRATAAEQRRLAPEPAMSQTQGRPTKRDRRDIERTSEERWSASLDP